MAPPGGNVAHVELGLVILAQPAVADGLQILGQAVVPGADLHILGVAHHGDVPLGADGERPGHGGVVLHTVAVLGDELHAGGQGLEVVQRLAVKVLGDGNGLVHVAQTDFGGFLFHHGGLCRRRADRLGVGHQVHESVSACRSRPAAGLDVLFVLKARGAPVTVQVYKGGQHRQAACIEDGLALTGQRAQILADGSDLAVPNVDFEGVPLGVHSMDEQHLNLPPCFGFNGRTARGRAKKELFHNGKVQNAKKKETTNPQQKRLQTAFSVLRASF